MNRKQTALIENHMGQAYQIADAFEGDQDDNRSLAHISLVKLALEKADGAGFATLVKRRVKWDLINAWHKRERLASCGDRAIVDRGFEEVDFYDWLDKQPSIVQMVASGLSQAEVGVILNTSQTTVSRILRSWRERQR